VVPPATPFFIRLVGIITLGFVSTVGLVCLCTASRCGLVLGVRFLLTRLSSILGTVALEVRVVVVGMQTIVGIFGVNPALRRHMSTLLAESAGRTRCSDQRRLMATA
jgi:hypothetical protein